MGSMVWGACASRPSRRCSTVSISRMRSKSKHSKPVDNFTPLGERPILSPPRDAASSTSVHPPPSPVAAIHYGGEARSPFRGCIRHVPVSGSGLAWLHTQPARSLAGVTNLRGVPTGVVKSRNTPSAHRAPKEQLHGSVRAISTKAGRSTSRRTGTSSTFERTVSFCGRRPIQ